MTDQTADARSLLAGRVAIVTGGGSGIGFYIAEALVAEGMGVAILGRRRDVLDRAAERLGERAFAVACDVRTPDQVRRAFAAVADRFARLDALVNNAAVFDVFRVADATDEELRATLEVNVLGALHCIREAVPLMRKSGGGDIVSISSESVMRPFPLLSVYAASKAALELLSRGLRNELRPDGIRVAVLRSGHVAVPDREEARWEPERAREFMAEAERGGYMADVGAGIDPRTTAAAVVTMLRQPAAASMELLELRGS
jgi:meso-butanediol dehydrogenase / (S,S)-butanediol dehydrogenase / diacetyl reductase